MLMARQIKLRRDQQKAKKAQIAVDIIEQSLRETVNLDLSLKKTVKSPLKSAINKKSKAQRQKSTCKLVSQAPILSDPTHLLKMRFEARHQLNETSEQDRDENQQNGAPVVPLPIHPMFRHFRTNNGYVI